MFVEVNRIYKTNESNETKNQPVTINTNDVISVRPHNSFEGHKATISLRNVCVGESNEIKVSDRYSTVVDRLAI